MPSRLAFHLQFVCPHCGRLQHLADLRAGGEMWYRCEARTCRRDFFAAAVPPGATGATLRAVLGASLAALVIRRYVPALRDMEDDDELWPLVLVGPERPAYLYLAAERRHRHTYRHAPFREIVRALRIA